MSIVAIFFLASQLMAIMISDVHDLHNASAMLGFAYGSMFGLFPTITIEWFGIGKIISIFLFCMTDGRFKHISPKTGVWFR